MKEDDYLNKKRKKIELDTQQEFIEFGKPRYNLNTSQTTPSASTSSGVNPFSYKEYTKNYYSILEKRKKLPAWEAKSHLIKLVYQHQILILQGETGSGKTTQIPQFLCEAGYINK
jgi:pre-mRNA-splicing factor ATP-dependent RNA helicase DHX15/PRP43